jgi:elongation factor Ts
MASTAAQVKELRDRTGAGMMDCKAALEDSKGDMQGAIEFLRKKGLADAAKKAGREARDGVIASYIHPGSKLGVLIEVNCETDFVARTEDFQQLVKDLTMQIAGVSTTAYVSREQVPPDLVEKEREIYRQQMADQKKPANVLDKIIDGKLERFYTETCLLDQPFVKDPTGKVKIKDLVDQATARLQERVVVKRFVRFQVGEA